MRRSAISMPVNSKEKEPLMPKINIVSNGNEKALETVKDVYPVIKSNPEIPTNLTILQKQKYAENEKNKGNDCLRAGELADALHYYSTSLSLSPTVAVFNNRALCNLKLKHYEDAAKDCTSSMEIEVTFKALLRRALANLNLARYQQGTSDVDAALEMEPESKEGLLLRKQIVDKWMDEEKNRVGDIQNATKVKIEEVHTFPKIQKIFDDKEETPVVKPKINIIEVDEDDSDDDF